MTSSTRDAVVQVNTGQKNDTMAVGPAAALRANWFPDRTASKSAKSTTTLPARAAVLLVPIRSLGSNHRGRICRHLVSLSARDRYLRFGYSAKDQHIEQYVAGLDFERDEVFGIFDRSLLLIAVAHLAYAMGDICDTGAEFGVSVLEPARGRGYGARLFERAAMHSTNKGVERIFIQALSENQPMLNIATKAGASIRRHGSESEAFLQLPVASLGSRLSEFLEDHVGQVDYRLKARKQRIPSFSANLGETDHRNEAVVLD